jgi:hypothetical protein
MPSGLNKILKYFSFKVDFASALRLERTGTSALLAFYHVHVPECCIVNIHSNIVPPVARESGVLVKREKRWIRFGPNALRCCVRRIVEAFHSLKRKHHHKGRSNKQVKALAMTVLGTDGKADMKLLQSSPDRDPFQILANTTTENNPLSLLIVLS